MLVTAVLIQLPAGQHKPEPGGLKVPLPHGRHELLVTVEGSVNCATITLEGSAVACPLNEAREEAVAQSDPCKNFPAAHAVHVCEPGAPHAPRGQQVPHPALDFTKPGPRPTAAAATVQRSQPGLVPLAENVPAGQGTGALAPAGQKLPTAPQAEHATAPARAKKPGAQHTDAFTGLNFPGGHGVHAAAPTVALNEFS